MKYLGISEDHAHFNNVDPEHEEPYKQTSYLDIPLWVWEEMGTPLQITFSIESGDTLNA